MNWGIGRNITWVQKYLETLIVTLPTAYKIIVPTLFPALYLIIWIIIACSKITGPLFLNIFWSDRIDSFRPTWLLALRLLLLALNNSLIVFPNKKGTNLWFQIISHIPVNNSLYLAIVKSFNYFRVLVSCLVVNT